MKKIITAIIIFAVIISGVYWIYSSNKSVEPTLQEKIDSKINAYYTELEDSLVTLTSKEKCINYLTTWAQTKDIKCKTDENGNVIYTRKSSKKYKDAPSTTIVCLYDSSDMDNSLNALSSAMYISKNKEGTGALTVIFADTSDNPDSAKTISPNYFDKETKVFTLSSSDTSSVINQSASRSVYKFTSKVKYSKPKYNKAYKLTIKGTKQQPENSNIESPNPVKQLGDVLATFKTKALIFELSNFKGGTSALTIPSKASCVIVVNENDTSKFEQQLRSSRNDFVKKYSSSFEDVDFTYEEVKVPRKVLSSKSSDKFISSLYTLIDGNHYDSSFTTSSVTTIGKVRINDSKSIISASACSLSEDTLFGIDESYNTVCSLAGIDYKLVEQEDSWSLDPDAPFSSELRKAYQQFTSSDLEYNELMTPSSAGQISLLTDKDNIIELYIAKDEIKDYTGFIIQYMINQLPTEE